MHMKTKYTLFRRGEVFYIQDSATGKQTSLRTKDETEARRLLEARNEAQRQPMLNLHLARASFGWQSAQGRSPPIAGTARSTIVPIAPRTVPFNMVGWIAFITNCLMRSRR